MTATTRGWVLLAIVVAALSSASVLARAAEDATTVTVDGVGAIHNPAGRAMARDAAIDDALRRAVEQSVGTFIDSETRVENARVLADRIYSKSKGYVHSYEVLRESEESGTIRVSVKAIVGLADIQHDLESVSLLARRVQQPRVVVVIPETHIGMRPPDPAGETEIVRKLIAGGFRVVDQAQVRRIRDSDSVKHALAGDIAAAREIARRYDAEILVIGEAFSQGATRDPQLANMISCRARLEARAIRADTGEILAADGVYGSGLDLTEIIAGKKALAAAGSQWVDRVVPVILDRWQAESSGSNSVELVISGISFAQLAKFKNVLRNQIRGINDVRQRTYAEKVATIEVDLDGPAQTMADELALQKFDDFRVEVAGFTANRLELTVVAR